MDDVCPLRGHGSCENAVFSGVYRHSAWVGHPCRSQLNNDELTQVDQRLHHGILNLNGLGIGLIETLGANHIDQLSGQVNI